MNALRSLVGTWLFLDFFGESRRSGKPGGTLTTAIVGQGFVALVLAALLYPDVPLVAFASANLSLVTVFAVLTALAQPERSARRRADLVLAGAAPLRRGTLALARGLHGAFGLAITTLGTALPSALLAGFLPGPGLGAAPLLLALAVLVAAIAHLALLVVQRALALVLTQLSVELVMATLKALTLAGAFLGFALCLSTLQKTALETPFGALIRAWPAWWSARIAAAPLAAGPFWLALLGTLALLAGLAALLPDAPPRRRLPSRAGGGVLDRLQGLLASTTEERGAARFAATMLLRSPGYRGKVLPLFGIPAAMIALTWRGVEVRDRALWLGMTAMLPAIYVPILVWFLPRSDQPGAGWLFANAPIDAAALGRRGATLALTTHVLLPAHAIALVAMLALQVAWYTSLAITCGALAVAVLATGLATRKLVAMPFTQPDEESGAGLDTGRLLAHSLVLGALGAGLGHYAASPLALPAALAAAVWAFARVRRAG